MNYRPRRGGPPQFPPPPSVRSAPQYAGESFTAALPGSSPLPWPSPRFREARHSLARPEGRLSSDAAGFASCYGPHRRSPFTGPLTLGSGPARFPAKPPACYRASWQLPGPDFHRRSEEHTSELQSRRDLVCRLLLEKKKRNNKKKRYRKSQKKNKEKVGKLILKK